MAAHDPVSAEIFGKIAEEEAAHIALAERFFPNEYRAERGLPQLAQPLQ